MTLGLQFARTALAVRRHPSASKAELKAFQDAQLRRLVTHAYDRVPYYRSLFDRNGLHPRHIRGTGDLHLIPISTKQELRNQPPSDLVARGIDPAILLTVCTSGSTGEPFAVRRTWLEQSFSVLFEARCNRAFGLGTRDRIARVGRAARAHTGDKKLVGRGLRAMGIHPTVKIDGMLPPDEIARQLAAFRPQMILALPGILCLTADHLIAAGRRDIRPRILLVGGEVLTPLMRRRLTEAFGVAPLQTYASHELPWLGWECKATGEIHTCDDAAVVEVLREGRPAEVGEDGEIVATNLHAYTMPFIRYRLADVVTRGSEQCACGQPFSTIRAIQGRMVDYFLLPDGRRVHPYRVLEGLQPGTDMWIRQYQFLQDRPDHITFDVVPLNARLLPELQEMVSRAVAPILGPGVEFQVRVVDDIPFGRGGKYRHCRSLVASGYNEAGSGAGND